LPDPLNELAGWQAGRNEAVVRPDGDHIPPRRVGVSFSRHYLTARCLWFTFSWARSLLWGAYAPVPSGL
jgi:hypothetical protein